MRSIHVVMAVARVTLTEILREKVLYSILIIGMLLMGVAFLSSKLTFVYPERIILDFGLAAVQLCSVAMAFSLGANLIGKEFERRTILVALSRPISRVQFLLGKFTGLAGILVMNWFFLSLVYIIILESISQGTYNTTPTLLWALIFALVESFVMAAFVMMVASFSTASLSLMLTVGVYLVGTNVSQIRFVATRMSSAAGSVILNSFAAVFPNLEYFHLGTKVTYGLPLSAAWIFHAFAYGTLWVSLCLGLAGLLIQRREA